MIPVWRCLAVSLGAGGLIVGAVGPRAVPARMYAAPPRAPLALTVNVPGVYGCGWTGGRGALYCVSSSGLYRTLGAPYTVWTRQNVSRTISAVAPHPLQPNDVVYVSDVTLYRSQDGGRTARAVYTTTGEAISRVIRAPGQPATLYASTRDAAYDALILRSSDDGLTWRVVYSVPATGTEAPLINAITVDPTVPTHVVAAVADYHHGYLVESRDGGTTRHNLADAWKLVEGETAAWVAPTVVTINPRHGTDIWTGWVGPASILAHSTDGGRRWRIVAGLPQSRDIMAIAVQPGTGFVYVTMATWQDRAMLYVSRDRVHFQRVAVPGATIGDSLLFSHTGRYLITEGARTPLDVCAWIAPAVCITNKGPPKNKQSVYGPWGLMV